MASKCKHCDVKISHHANSRHFSHIILRCKKARQEDKDELSDIWNSSIDQSDTIGTNYTLLLTKVILKNNLPLRLVDCELFRTLCRMNPPHRFPGRHRISSFYIPRVAGAIKDRFICDTEKGADCSLSIEFDHWTDAMHRSLLAVLATRSDGSRYLIEVEDVSTTGHSAASILATLNRVLECFQPLKINSLVSDAASSCTRARCDFVRQEKYRHVIHQRCIAHLINLIGKDICENTEVEAIIKNATKLVAILNSDSKVMVEFAKAGQRRCARYVKTRWYSMVTMLETLVDCHDVAIAALSSAINNSRAQANIDRVEVLSMLESDLFGPNLHILVAIFRPLANCIAIAECEDSRLGDAMKAVLDFARSLFDSDWEIEFVLPTIMSFLTHFNTTKLFE